MPFNLLFFASPAGGLRNQNVAVFASLKKYAMHFFNTAVGDTEANKATNPVTGIENASVVIFKCGITTLIGNIPYATIF